MNRRTFVIRSLAGTMGSSLMSRWSATGLAAADSPAIDIQSLLESSDPKLMRLLDGLSRQYKLKVKKAR